MQDYVLFPAIHIGNMELLLSLKSMKGQKVLAILKKDFYERFNPPIDDFIIDDFSDMDQLESKIDGWLSKHNARIISAIGIDDDDQFIITKTLASHFKTGFYSDDTLKKSSNKYCMKQAFFSNGVPTAKCTLISDKSKKAASQLRFPNVLKLIQGSGSEYLFMNKSPEEMKSNLSYLLSVTKNLDGDCWFNKTEYNGTLLDPKEQFLLEEYIEGDEYSCDFLVNDGYISILRIVKKFPLEQFGFFKGFYLINKETAMREGLMDLEKICGNIAKAFNLSKGICMVDFKKDDEGIKIIETSVRPGFSTFIHLMYELYGYTSLGIMARLMSNKLDRIDRPDSEGIVYHIFTEKTGIITRFDTDSIVPGKENVIAVHKYNKPGDVIRNSKIDYWDHMLGYVVLKIGKGDRIQKIFKTLDQKIIIETKNE